MIWGRKKKTPLRKLLNASGLLVGKRNTPRRRRELLAKLEHLRQTDPEKYAAFLSLEEHLTSLAEAVYPPPEEQKRLVELKNPQDQRRPGERADEA